MIHARETVGALGDRRLGIGGAPQTIQRLKREDWCSRGSWASCRCRLGTSSRALLRSRLTTRAPRCVSLPIVVCARNKGSLACGCTRSTATDRVVRVEFSTPEMIIVRLLRRPEQDLGATEVGSAGSLKCEMRARRPKKTTDALCKRFALAGTIRAGLSRRVFALPDVDAIAHTGWVNMHVFALTWAC